MSDEEQAKLLKAIRGLMLADNLGDVHDEIFLLCDLAALPRLRGNFLDGWTAEDWKNVGREAARPGEADR